MEGGQKTKKYGAEHVALVLSFIAIIVSSVQAYVAWDSRDDLVKNMYLSERLKVCASTIRDTDKYTTASLAYISFLRMPREDELKDLLVKNSLMTSMQNSFNELSTSLIAADLYFKNGKDLFADLRAGTNRIYITAYSNTEIDSNFDPFQLTLPVRTKIVEFCSHQANLDQKD